MRFKLGSRPADRLKRRHPSLPGFGIVQISAFTPLAPLSPTHRGETAAPDADAHNHDPAQSESSVTGVGQALGLSLPPRSLLPAVGAASIISGSSTPTEADQEPAVELPGGGGIGDTSDETSGLPKASSEEGDSAESGLSAGAGQELTDEERAEVDELKSRDREVRQHEQAHMAAAGPYANGGPSFEYTRGPDGKRYAVGGEVQIDTSRESEPEATIRKAQQIYRAALAPADPSSQDRSVASQAKKMEMEARSELSKQQAEEGNSSEVEAAEAAGATPAGKPSETETIPLPGSGPPSSPGQPGLGASDGPSDGRKEPSVGELLGGGSDRPPAGALLSGGSDRPPADALLGGRSDSPPAGALLGGRSDSAPAGALLGGRSDSPPAGALLGGTSDSPSGGALLGGGSGRPTPVAKLLDLLA